MFPKQSPYVVVLTTLKRAISARLTGAKITPFQAKLAPKIVLYVIQRNGPILGAEINLFDLQCSRGGSGGKVGVKLKNNFRVKTD